MGDQGEEIPPDPPLPRLDHLPIEVIERITDWLDAIDLRDVRSVCKALQRKTARPFGTWCFSLLKTTLSRGGMDKLRGIAQLEGVRDCVREISLDVVPYGIFPDYTEAYDPYLRSYFTQLSYRVESTRSPPPRQAIPKKPSKLRRFFKSLGGRRFDPNDPGEVMSIQTIGTTQEYTSGGTIHAVGRMLAEGLRSCRTFTVSIHFTQPPVPEFVDPVWIAASIAAASERPIASIWHYKLYHQVIEVSVQFAPARRFPQPNTFGPQFREGPLLQADVSHPDQVASIRPMLKSGQIPVEQLREIDLYGNYALTLLEELLLARAGRHIHLQRLRIGRSSLSIEFLNSVLAGSKDSLTALWLEKVHFIGRGAFSAHLRQVGQGFTRLDFLFLIGITEGDDSITRSVSFPRQTGHKLWRDVDRQLEGEALCHIGVAIDGVEMKHRIDTLSRGLEYTIC